MIMLLEIYYSFKCQILLLPQLLFSDEKNIPCSIPKRTFSTPTICIANVHITMNSGPRLLEQNLNSRSLMSRRVIIHLSPVGLTKPRQKPQYFGTLISNVHWILLWHTSCPPNAFCYYSSWAHGVSSGDYTSQPFLWCGVAM